MNQDAEAALKRRDLDTVLNKWRKLRTPVPARGWVYELRMALGMTASDLAKRMKMSAPAVVSLESSEAKGSIQLATLRRAAQAMDCALVYAIVPRYHLEHMVQNRRKRIAVKDLGMVLQGKVGSDYRDLIAAYAQTIKRNRVWRELE